MSEDIVRVENLEKIYPDGTRALKGLSFSVKPGDFVAILGKSGSGKSTLLRCINRLVEPTKGRIFFRDQEITSANPAQLRRLRRKIGMIFQQYNLVKQSSVLTNVLAGRLGYLPGWAGLFNYFPREVVIMGKQILKSMEVEKVFQRADQLSGGQQQRVGIARALMQKPEIILADEPVSSLDPASARTIMNILADINRKRGVTLLCNLHSPDLALAYGSRILGMQEGRLVFDGSPDQWNSALAARVYGSETVSPSHE